MKNFTNYDLWLYTDILFGKDTEKESGRMVRKHGGTRVLVVYGGGSVKKNGLLNRVTKALTDEGLYVTEFGGVQPNPRRSHVEKGVKAAKEAGADFVLAVGGGSVIDTAKAIGLALAHGGEYWRFYNGVQAEKTAPVGTVHTISAAGSEMSRSSVLVDDIDTGFKLSLNWDCCRPVFAIMNPELTYTVSAYQTAAGAVDIVAHTVSRYFMKDMPVSCLGDELGEGLMRTVVKFAPAALAAPNDYEARAELMLAAAFSHNDITGVGRSGQRGGEHALERQLSAGYDTAHGAGLAAIMPAWLQYIVNNGTDAHLARIARFGVKVFGASPGTDAKAVANAGLEAFRAWVRSIGMPLTLAELGIPRTELSNVIERTLAVNKGKISGFMDLDEKAVTAIFNSL